MTNKVNTPTSLAGHPMEAAMQDGMEKPVSAEALQREIATLKTRVEKLERGIRLAKVHFGNAEPTKAERMLDIAMEKPE